MKGKYIILDETPRGCELFDIETKNKIIIPIEDAQIVIKSLKKLLKSSQRKYLMRG